MGDLLLGSETAQSSAEMYWSPLFIEFYLSPCASPVLPGLKWLLTPAQAVTDWDAVTKQSRRAVSSAQLSHP